jgi:hypothetical protein
MRIRSGLLVVLGLLLAMAPLLAHHSNAAQFDAAKRTTLKGSITKVAWSNPHAFIFVDVKDAAGKTVNWELEGYPPNTLLRTGWSQKDMKEGDVITFEGCLARDGSAVMLAREITLVSGVKKWWGPER